MAEPESAESALRRAVTALTDSGSTEAFTEARMLLEGAAGLDRLALLRDPDRRLTADETARLDACLDRRRAGEPVTRILGRRGFWSLDLAVTPDVLDPRPDTETLIEAALVALAGRMGQPLRVLDLGTGSGAILCALLAELPHATGIGVDVSVAAAEVARRNVAACGLADRAAIVTGRWFEPVEGAFDVIVSNPPYIPSGDIAGLEREVRDFDPRLALDGGADGLDAYRALLPPIAERLAPDGVAVLEFGLGQAADVAGLARAAGLGRQTVRRDLAGHERAIVLLK